MTGKHSAQVLFLGLAGAAAGGVGIPRAAEARAARESIAQAVTARERLDDQFEGVTLARGQKEELATEWLAGRVSLRELTDAYLALDRLTAVGPNLAFAEAGPRWIAARSAVVRARFYAGRLPANEREAVRRRLLSEFAREFPDRPLTDWQ